MIVKEIESKDKFVALNKCRFYGMYQLQTINIAGCAAIRYAKPDCHCKTELVR